MKLLKRRHSTWPRRALIPTRYRQCASSPAIVSLARRILPRPSAAVTVFKSSPKYPC